MATERASIAVVDDEGAVRRALARLFSASNFDVKTFDSGKALLDVLPTWHPDCIVLDFQMPGLTGLNVLETLTSEGWNCPVIMITGHDSPDVRGRCMVHRNVLTCLGKPLDEADLMAATNMAVAKNRAARDAADRQK